MQTLVAPISRFSPDEKEESKIWGVHAHSLQRNSKNFQGGVGCCHNISQHPSSKLRNLKNRNMLNARRKQATKMRFGTPALPIATECILIESYEPQIHATRGERSLLLTNKHPQHAHGRGERARKRCALRNPHWQSQKTASRGDSNLPGRQIYLPCWARFLRYSSKDSPLAMAPFLPRELFSAETGVGSLVWALGVPPQAAS